MKKNQQSTLLKPILIAYWDCGLGHHHETEADAYECLTFVERVPQYQLEARRRVAAAVRLHAEGKTYQEIGRLLGRHDDPDKPVSSTVGRNLVLRGLRKATAESRPFGTLSTRSANVIRNLGFETDSEFLIAIDAGLVNADVLEKTPNCGRTTIREINDWVARKKNQS